MPQVIASLSLPCTKFVTFQSHWSINSSFHLRCQTYHMLHTFSWWTWPIIPGTCNPDSTIGVILKSLWFSHHLHVDFCSLTYKQKKVVMISKKTITAFGQSMGALYWGRREQTCDENVWLSLLKMYMLSWYGKLEGTMHEWPTCELSSHGLLLSSENSLQSFWDNVV